MDLSIRDRDEVLSPTHFRITDYYHFSIDYFYLYELQCHPRCFATHWNAAGEVDGRTEKHGYQLL